VARTNAGLEDPESTWPGVLFLEVPLQGLVVGEMRSLAGLSEFDKRDLAARVLPTRIRTSRADRFAWVMPAWRADSDGVSECLVILLAEPGHREALVADIIRGDGPPLLSEWTEPSYNVAGLFADPLCRPLLAKPRPKRRRAQSRSRPGRGPTQSARRRKEERGQAERSPSGRPLRLNCPDCGAAIGEPHRPRCDVECCSVCFGQRLLCDCPGHDPLAVVWEGEWPGATACRTLGWWAIRTDDGWRPCPPGTPGAIEDINRLTFFRETGMDCLYDQLD
jgi:hypothetical protein